LAEPVPTLFTVSAPVADLSITFSSDVELIGNVKVKAVVEPLPEYDCDTVVVDSVIY
jgi:hypothetical protein